MLSPAMIETVIGRKIGSVMVRPARAAKTPLWVTWARNVGPPPPPGPPAKRRTSMMTTGTRASTASRAHTRRRRNSVASSLRNIEALPGQRHECVLQAGTLHGEATDADACFYEGAAQVLGRAVAEVGH